MLWTLSGNPPRVALKRGASALWFYGVAEAWSRDFTAAPEPTHWIRRPERRANVGIDQGKPCTPDVTLVDIRTRYHELPRAGEALRVQYECCGRA